MNKHITQHGTISFRGARRLLQLPATLRLVVLAGLVVVGGVGIGQQPDAHATETSSAYCSQYSSSTQKAACSDGILGKNCSDYAIVADQATADICSKAKSDKKSGLISDTPVAVTTSQCSSYTGDLLQACQGGADFKQCNSAVASTDPELYQACLVGAGQSSSNSSGSSNSSSGSSSSSGNSFSAQDLLDQSSTLTQLISALDGISSQSGSGLTGGGGSGCSGGSGGSSTGISSSASSLSALGSLLGGNTSTGLGGNNSGTNSTDVLSSLGGLLGAANSVGGIAGGLNGGNGCAADNNYGSYVNGAGKQQPLVVYPCNQQGGAAAQVGSQTKSVITNASGQTIGNITSTTSTGGCPAILYLDGGGWHTDDQTAKYLASGSSQKNGSGKDEGAPAGGGANARGYTVIEITYRLGSDGVYYMLDDVLRGIRHVLNNAGMYGIDATKTAVWGDSAGGSLSVRAAATGKSGVKAAVGWSAPTNAYTGLFKSFSSFAIGIDHSTCIPTDLAGLDNTTSLLTGGSGNVAQEGQGLSSNDFSALGIGSSGDGSSGNLDPISTLSQVLVAAQYASQTSQNVESISQQLQSGLNTGSGSGGGASSLSGLLSSNLASGVFNLSSQKLIECIDNFNTLSPALFASTETPPTFLAGFDDDTLVDPQQAYDMRDKLHSLGIRSDVLILPGDPDAAANAPAIGASDNHLGYDPRFVCWTINQIDSVIRPDQSPVDCANPSAPTQSATDSNGSGGGSGSSNGGGSSTSGGSGGGGGSSNSNPSGCGGLGSSATCNGSSNGGTPTSCPPGLVPGSHSCVQPIGGGSNGGTPNNCDYGYVPGSHSCVAAKCPEGGTPQYDQWGTSYWCK